MAAQASCKVLKTITDKGVTRTWSNRHHFTNALPASNADMDTMADAIVADEKLIYTSAITITGVVFYAAGSDMPVHSKAYTTAGTLALPSGGVLAPSDCVYLTRFLTDIRTSKNHPLYLFSYSHGVLGNTGQGHDEVDATQRSRYHNWAQAWVNGYTVSGTNHKRCGPNGAVAYDYLAPVPAYITHRDFPR